MDFHAFKVLGSLGGQMDKMWRRNSTKISQNRKSLENHWNMYGFHCFDLELQRKPLEHFFYVQIQRKSLEYVCCSLSVFQDRCCLMLRRIAYP